MIVIASSARADATYDFSVVAFGSSYLNAGNGLCVDSQGNLYVVNGATVLKRNANGFVTSIAVPVSNTVAMAVDSNNALYLVDQSGARVMKGTPASDSGTYVFTTLIGSLSTPTAVAADSLGNVYVSERGPRRIRKIAADGTATILATLSGTYGIGPYGIAVDSTGNVYVSMLFSSASVLKITQAGVVSTFATIGTVPLFLAMDRTDTLYGINGGTLRKISPAGSVTTTTVPSSSSSSLAVDQAGNVYVYYNGYIYCGLCRPALNDAFGQAAPISGTFGQFAASNLGATKESGEPAHAADAGGHSLWWKWTAPTSGKAVFSAGSGSFVPLLGVYQGTDVTQLTPVVSSTQGTVIFDATAGSSYSIAVDGAGGAVGTVTLTLNPSGVTGWGYNYYGQLNISADFGPATGFSAGNYQTLLIKGDGTVAALGSFGTPPSIPSNLTGVAGVSASFNGQYYLALKSDGSVVSWGSGTSAPDAATLSNAVAVSAGNGKGLALKSDGTIASWGSPSLNFSGLSGVIGVAYNGTDTLLLKNDGTVTGSYYSSSSLGSGNTVAVALGGYFALALKSDGTVVSSGSISALPTAANNNIVAIAAGYSHALALKSDGTVVAWGSNSYGETTVPVGVNGVVSISAGYYSSLALQASAAPVFSAQPPSTAVNAGSTVTLGASANASSYQWYQGTSGDTSAPVSGATKPWLVTVALSASTSYWVRATNAFGTADSRTATVTVYPKPANDDFANATALTGSSVHVTGTNVGASWEAGEQYLVYNFLGLHSSTAGQSVWWAWTAPSDGVVTMDTQGSDFSNLLSVYAGGSVASLYPVASGSASGGANTSKATFQVTAGATYMIEVNGAANTYGVSSGNITLNIALSTAYAPAIISQPVSFTISNGVRGTVSVSYLAYPLPVIQWQRLAAGSTNWARLSDDATFSGSATATLGFVASTAMYGDQFRCILDNGLSTPVTSSPAPLVVSVPYVYTTYAGTAQQSGNVDAGGASARFTHPVGLALDASDNLYVADDQAHVIRKIAPDGTVTTLAGLAGQSGYVDGPGSTARFNRPAAVAVDASGTVYVADASNNAIREITPDGTVTTLAGSPSTSVFSNPSAVAVDAVGTVYVADTYHYSVCTITPAGVVSVLAGSSSHLGTADGIGAAAQFGWPSGVAVDGGGNVYVADYFYGIIRKIAPGAVVTTLAGFSGAGGGIDGQGMTAGFVDPKGVALDSAGNVFVADLFDELIRKITPDGVVSTIGGLRNYIGSTDATGTAARFYFPSGIAVDRNGVLFVADSYNYTVRKGVPVATSPFITASPFAQTVTTSQDATFKTFADGFPTPVYQWQSLPAGASIWTDLADGGLFSGSGTSTLIIAGGPIDLSGEQFRCVATNGVGLDASGGTATLTVTVPAFSDWAGALGLSGPSASASAAPFTDGLPNLARYAMNLGAAPAVGQLPSLGYETAGATNYVALQFRERKGMSAVLLGAESSTDLQSWQPLAPDAIISLPDDDMNTARFKARMPIPAGGRIFIRLRATQSP